jgi:uncharacterized alpha-E superfamily protein
MLSRTAAQLYWMSRYLERAENLVRMLDVTHSLSLLPQSRGAATELAAPLAVTGTLEAYQARHARLSAEELFRFMGIDLENPGERPCGAGPDHGRDVGSHQHQLAGST